MLGLILPHFVSLQSPLVVRPAKVVAKYSYGIYLAHSLALASAFYLIQGLTLGERWLIFVALSVALPILMYHVIEEPMIRLGLKVAKRLSATRPRKPKNYPRTLPIPGFSKHSEAGEGIFG